MTDLPGGRVDGEGERVLPWRVVLLHWCLTAPGPGLFIPGEKAISDRTPRGGGMLTPTHNDMPIRNPCLSRLRRGGEAATDAFVSPSGSSQTRRLVSRKEGRAPRPPPPPPPSALMPTAYLRLQSRGERASVVLLPQLWISLRSSSSSPSSGRKTQSSGLEPESPLGPTTPSEPTTSGIPRRRWRARAGTPSEAPSTATSTS